MSLIPNLDSLYETVGNKVDGDILFAEVINRFDTSNVNASNYINMINPKEVIPIHYGSIVGNKDLGLKFSELVNSNINVKVFIK